MDEARWHVHGNDPGHLVLYRSVEEGPLAEISCHGDVDPYQVRDALNRLPAVTAERDALREAIEEAKSICDAYIEDMARVAPDDEVSDGCERAYSFIVRWTLPEPASLRGTETPETET